MVWGGGTITGTRARYPSAIDQHGGSALRGGERVSCGGGPAPRGGVFGHGGDAGWRKSLADAAGRAAGAGAGRGTGPQPQGASRSADGGRAAPRPDPRRAPESAQGGSADVAANAAGLGGGPVPRGVGQEPRPGRLRHTLPGVT